MTTAQVRDNSAIWQQCSNVGKWGPDDELGCLNYITPATRLRAAGCVRTGETVSIGRDLTTVPHPRKHPGGPLTHIMMSSGLRQDSASDWIGVAPHAFDITHLDAIAHVTRDGVAYNGRDAHQVVKADGLHFGSIHAQREGIVTRGVFLDVAAARGVPWLADGDEVTAADLSRAEELAGVRVSSGDAIVVHIGLEAREAALGEEDPLSQRAGLTSECMPWIHQREVSLYTGDCIERIPFTEHPVAQPLHEIGLISMGLTLLDGPAIADLRTTCQRLNRYEFMLFVSPLRIPRGTGSPVNPICMF